jgi:hypothetical protein
MPINPSKLVAAAMLQDYIVDKDSGFPLANGLVSLYIDTQRQTFKNWYYQTGVPGAYTYIPLDNPMNLSSVGTIQDPNGNDVIPYYYPFEENDENTPEKYYITVYSVDSNGNAAVLQFTRENFPPIQEEEGPTIGVPSLRNYILNNVYWRNIGALNATSVTNQIIAPSQHDGFTNGEIRFIKNVTGATDNIAFTPMTETLEDDITPETQLNFVCSATQTGETQKCIQYPIALHIDTLQNVEATIVIHAQNIAGNVNNFLDIYIYQFTGTGALTQPAPIFVQRIVLGNTYQKFIVPVTLPNAEGLSLGSGGDDALFLQIQYPLSSLFGINHTKPQIYLSESVPDNDFDTYDQIETIINSPRTGDIRTSLNAFYPWGYVPMNDGTIGDTTSNATARQNSDTWQLFNLIWSIGKPYDSGSNFNPIAQMFTMGGAATNYGASAIVDFEAFNALALTKMFGRVLAGTVPIAALLAVYSQAITATNVAGSLVITVTTGSVFFIGQPIVFTTTGTLPGNIVANAVYYVTNLSGNAFNVATTYANALARTPVVAFSSAGSNSTVTVQPTGSFIGETLHTLTIPEMPSHVHPPAAGETSFGGTGSPGTYAGASGITRTDQSTTGATGGGLPHNNIQPETFYNVFIKL